MEGGMAAKGRQVNGQTPTSRKCKWHNKGNQVQGHNANGGRRIVHCNVARHTAGVVVVVVKVG